ncbi:MAG TPA: Na/Pi cotransporter family protein [Clostridiaceae bacterium]|nr:Na/Pi cotransporter family protein [Clostridiaceae bacterium]
MKTLFIILYNFFAGTICLIFGLNQITCGLERANTGLLKKILEKYTGNIITSFIAGTIITALVQSSAAVTVITVSLVNAGLMSLYQAMGIIYGANIGTTITAQLMSINLTKYALPVLITGLVIRAISRKKNIRNIGITITGLGLLFLGINILHSGVPILKKNPVIFNIFSKYGCNPYIGLIVGMIATMLVQSSSATVGLTIVLFNGGIIGLEGAIGLTLGDNIGTCISAQIASIGTSLPARQTAWAHTIYNIIGSIIALIFISPFTRLVEYITNFIGQDSTHLVANAHTIFNILSALLFFPFTRYFVYFIEWIVHVPDKNSH